MTRIFFATDIHGSEVCWKKFLNAGAFYDVDVLVLGGDMTGKAIVPIVQQGGRRYRVVLLEQEHELQGDDALAEMMGRIRSRGYYPYVTTPEELAALKEDPQRVEQLFIAQVLQTMEKWLAYADTKLDGTGLRCYVAPGNDDMFQIDALIRASRHVTLAEGQAIALDEHHTMISSGWTNITPWHTFREEPEEALHARLSALVAQLPSPRTAVFNFHVPPYGSTLDDAPELTADLRPKRAGNATVPAGSRAVRDLIEQHQPLLALCGHIHEARGSVRLGRTLCINPGSAYEQGRLLGAVIQLERGTVKHYVLTTG